MGQHNLRFCVDADLLRFFPKLEQIWPRSKNGQPVNNWDVQISLAMDEIERRLRARKGTAEPIELGRLGLRSKERLRDPTACLALRYIFSAADSAGDDQGYLARKSAEFRQMAEDMLEDEIQMIDYDADNSGTIDDFEKNQPLPIRFIRG